MVVVLSVVWTVNRTVQRARASNQWVVHTQEVLTAIEAVLAKVADGESAVRGYVSSGDARVLEPLDRTERTIDTDVDRLAALTADNPSQQFRITALRQGAMRALAALRARADAKRTARPFSQADVDALQAGMDAARTTMQAMRAEENRLLAERVQADQAAVLYLQWLSIALVIAAIGLLGWIGWLQRPPSTTAGTGGAARRERRPGNRR